MSSRKALATVIVVGLLVPPLAMHFYLQHRISGAATDLLAPFAQHADISVGKAFYQLDGSFGLTSLEIRPRDESQAATRSGRITLQSPGWAWTLAALHQTPAATRLLLAPKSEPAELTETDEEPVLQSGAPRIKRLPEARRLAIEITSLDLGSGDILPLPFDLAGWASASLFEAEGCLGVTHWRASDLGEMGLDHAGTHWRWEYRVTGPNEVHTFATLHAPGIARLERISRLRSPSAEHHLSNEARANVLLTETISLRDEGFVQARNRHCATQDGTNLPVFLQRHWQAIERLLQTMGLQATGELRSVYSRFARDGGELVMQAEPASAALPPEASIHQRLRSYNASLRRGETAPVALRFQSIAPRPLPAEMEGGTIDLVLQEPADSEEVSEFADIVAEPGIELARLLRRGRPSLFQVLPTAAEVLATPEGTEETVPPAEVSGGPARITPIDESHYPSTERRDLAYEELSDHQGRVVRLFLADGRSRVGTIEAFSSDSVRVQVSMPSGSAVYDIARSNIRRAHWIE